MVYYATNQPFLAIHHCSDTDDLTLTRQLTCFSDDEGLDSEEEDDEEEEEEDDEEEEVSCRRLNCWNVTVPGLVSYDMCV